MATTWKMESAITPTDSQSEDEVATLVEEGENQEQLGTASLSGPGVSDTKAENAKDLDQNELNPNDTMPDEELEQLFQDCKDFITRLEMEEKSKLDKKCERKSEPKWKTMKNVVRMVTKLNNRPIKMLPNLNPNTEFQGTEAEKETKTERTSQSYGGEDFLHLNSEVARKLALLKREECREVGGSVWDCQICLSLAILHLRLTHDIYHESPRCLLSNIHEDL